MHSDCFLTAAALTLSAQPREMGGVYPHLAVFDEGNVCCTGRVVP